MHPHGIKTPSTIFNSILLIIANWGGGLFIDLTGDYRNVYSWDAFFTFAALLAMLMVWRGWKRYWRCSGLSGSLTRSGYFWHSGQKTDVRPPSLTAVSTVPQTGHGFPALP